MAVAVSIIEAVVAVAAAVSISAVVAIADNNAAASRVSAASAAADGAETLGIRHNLISQPRLIFFFSCSNLAQKLDAASPACWRMAGCQALTRTEGWVHQR